MLEKSILQYVLAVMARATICRYKPMIIGVTGSVGKTSTRLAIYAVVKGKYRAATAEKNYNNEIGLPLAILGMHHYGHNIFGWLYGLKRVAWRLVFKNAKYPEVLVLEYGVDRPGDMDYLLSLARPDIAVVTAIGEVPAHVEFFKDPEELIAEKAKLVSSLAIREESTNVSDRKQLLTPAVSENTKDKYAILNHDDEDVFDMREKTQARVLTFGAEEHAEVRMSNYKLFIARDAEAGEVPEGITFKMSYKGSEVPVRLDGVFGMPHAYAGTAAATVGVVLGMNPVRGHAVNSVGNAIAERNKSTDAVAPGRFASNGMNLVEIAEALRGYTPPPGRMRLIKGNKHSLILDDTYNAAPESMRAALDTLQELPGKRKIAVLGDMREIGAYTEQAHRAIGDRAAEFVDMLLCVGPAAKFIADEAKTRGVEKHARRLAPAEVLMFDDAGEAGRALDPMIREGDVILVKGSQSVRMEKVVEEIMADPEKAENLLVRQEEYWK